VSHAGLLPALAAVFPALAAMCSVPTSAAVAGPPQQQQQRRRQLQQQPVAQDAHQSEEQLQDGSGSAGAADQRTAVRKLSSCLLDIWVAAVGEILPGHYRLTFVAEDGPLLPWRHQQCLQTMLPASQLAAALLETCSQQHMPLTAAVSNGVDSSSSSSSSTPQQAAVATDLQQQACDVEASIQRPVEAAIVYLANLLYWGLCRNSNRPFVLQQLVAAPAGTLHNIWWLLLLKLAWAVDAQQTRQHRTEAAAGSSSSSSVKQFLSAMRAPPAVLPAADEDGACSLGWLTEMLVEFSRVGQGLLPILLLTTPLLAAAQQQMEGTASAAVATTVLNTQLQRLSALCQMQRRCSCCC
jgi:hypothetical protein